MGRGHTADLDSERQIIHLDMDAFYASVEQREQPALRGKPVVVGWPSRRSVVCAASYEARPFGVRSAMPMFEALRRCPNATVIAPNMTLYAKVSHQVFAILRRFTPLVEGLSIDEAFLDVTASKHLFGDGAVVAARLRQAIRQELDLPASAGVAPNKFVAKIASDFAKPDGLYVVRSDAVQAFLSPLPIDRMWGVGPKTAKRLHAEGLYLFEDLARASLDTLRKALGSSAERMQQLALGLDDRPVEPEHERKSISAEETFDQDVFERSDLERSLLSHAERITDHLIRLDMQARVVAVKIKYQNFQVRTRQKQLAAAISDTTTLYRTAYALLDAFSQRNLGIRLIGLAVRDLQQKKPTAHAALPDSASPSVEMQEQRQHKLDAAKAQLRQRFGAKVVQRAALIAKDKRDTRT